MKRFIAPIICVLMYAAVANAQSASFLFRFDTYSEQDNKESDDADVTMTLYDNSTVTITGSVRGKGSVNYSLHFESLGIALNSIVCLYESGTMEKDKPYIVLSRNLVIYYDAARNFKCSFYDSKDINGQALENCLEAIKNKNGPFSNFRGEAEMELPLRVDNSDSNTIEITHPAEGGRVMHLVKTKSGKTLDQTSYKDYTIESSASWCQVKYKTENAFHIVTDANTTGSPREATITIQVRDIRTWVFVTQPSMTSKINKVWVEHNKFQGLAKGMKIHVDFETYNVKGKSGSCSAYFYFSNGQKLMDYNYQYRTSDGQVCTWTDFTPAYDQARFADAVLFIPYSELHISGSANCKFFVQVSVGGQSTSSEYYEFSIN